MRCPRSSVGTVTTPTSITLAAENTDECAPSVQAMAHPCGGRAPLRSATVVRAVTSADSVPIVPPATKHPPAPGGHPSRSTSHPSASFSA